MALGCTCRDMPRSTYRLKSELLTKREPTRCSLTPAELSSSGYRTRSRDFPVQKRRLLSSSLLRPREYTQRRSRSSHRQENILPIIGPGSNALYIPADQTYFICTASGTTRFKAGFLAARTTFRPTSSPFGGRSLQITRGSMNFNRTIFPSRTRTAVLVKYSDGKAFEDQRRKRGSS